MASIKANQYRIGNLMRDGITGALLRVDGLYYEIQNERIDYYLMDRDKFPLPDGWHAEPIPLTEEWLLKFGGIIKPDAVLFNGVHFLYEDGIVYFESENNGRSNTEIKHVHQLQNLYFALTGEELKFNL